MTRDPAADPTRKPRPGIWFADQQPCADQHTPDPSGYGAWFEWAARMSRTHRPTRCPDCKLWAIWVPKATIP